VTRRATKIKEFQKENEHLLLLDAGGSLLGDRVFSQQSKGATSIEAMNLLGYDAMALAREDLDLGVEELGKRIQEADFPVLAANVRLAGSGELAAQDYVIRNIGGQHVAIVGLTEQCNVSGFTVTDPLQTLQSLLPEVKEKANIIILLTHITPSAIRSLAGAMGDVDMIISGGNEHLALGEFVGGALMVHADVASAGHAGRNMGLVTMAFDNQGAMTNQNNTIAVLSEAAVTEDEAMLAWLQSVQVVSAAPATPAQ